MRLIDADEIGLTDFEIVMCNGDYKEALKMLLDEIQNKPTSYSVENVVAELEELRDRYDDGIKNFAIRRIIGKAIEIVKQGGVSDDVCEWESASAGEFIQNPHTKRLYSNEPSMKNIYCNTCGKKIKVVK